MSKTTCGTECDCHELLLPGLHCSGCDPDGRAEVVEVVDGLARLLYESIFSNPATTPSWDSRSDVTKSSYLRQARKLLEDGWHKPVEGGTAMSTVPDNGKVHRFGLDLDREAFDRLRAALDRVTEAELAAWRNL